jgi:hypothetical protein
MSKHEKRGKGGMLQRIRIMRNLLISIAAICELVSAATLVVGTRRASEVASIGPLVAKVRGLAVEGKAIDRAILAIQAQDSLLRRLNELARSLARVISAIGFLLLFLAWWVHRWTALVVSEGEHGAKRHRAS